MEPDKSKSGKSPQDAAGQKEKVAVGLWKSSERAVRRSFPGPREANALLRIAVDREAYAELIAHAKASLEKEICGVLVGTVCEDDRGLFVHVAAVIRGSAASHGSTHVTFTQETWNTIHRTLEQDYPKLHMVGWYHSHPGFGVEFSDMDIFIQKNFFSSPTQIALVMDPLSGAVAICINTESGIKYLDRFWVDGREQACQVPKQSQQKSASGSGDESNAGESLRNLEARVGQLVQALDDQKVSFYRFLLFIGITVCFVALACLGYTYYSNYKYRNTPQPMNQFALVPVQIGDKTALLGVEVVKWEIPDEINAISATLKKLEDERAALAAATNQAGTNVPAPSATTNKAEGSK